MNWEQILEFFLRYFGTWQQVFGSATLIFALAMVFWGLPSQIKKNYLEKRCGQPINLITLALAVYASRMGYAITINSWYILIPDVFGVSCSIILVIQHFRYRSISLPS